jgi:sec-independent protein translocase protein TatA
MFDLGGGELLLILVFVLVFFGPKKLPQLAQSMGKGLREFKRAQREFSNQINTAFEEEERKTRKTAEQQAQRPAESVARGSSSTTSSQSEASTAALNPPDQQNPAAENRTDQPQQSGSADAIHQSREDDPTRQS